MSTSAVQLLAPLVDRRFQSFADIAEVAMDAAAAAIPGMIVLGQLEPEESRCRVLDTQGSGLRIEAGQTLPLAAPHTENGSLIGVSPASTQPAAEWLDPVFVRSQGVASALTVPLEMSDGNVAGLLCALAAEEGAYRSDDIVLLALVARMLSYEWERVRSRAELRRMRQRAHDPQHTDPDTGLANRASFAGLLEREWKLARRGTVRSMVVACEVTVEGEEHGEGSPMAVRALKDAAEVLAAAVRTTDHVGRISTMGLGVVMIGAERPEHSEALIRRYSEALARATGERPVDLAVSFGAFPLHEADSSEQALARSEAAAARREEVWT